jgi:hypothetical protein
MINMRGGPQSILFSEHLHDLYNHDTKPTKAGTHYRAERHYRSAWKCSLNFHFPNYFLREIDGFEVRANRLQRNLVFLTSSRNLAKQG